MNLSKKTLFRALALAVLTAMFVLAGGCELLVDFDRSLIDAGGGGEGGVVGDATFDRAAQPGDGSGGNEAAADTSVEETGADTSVEETGADTSTEDADGGQADAADSSVADSADAHDAADTSQADSADTSVADTSVADTSVADTSVADTSVADTSVADTSVADTSVADTSVADTSVADAADAADASLGAITGGLVTPGSTVAATPTTYTITFTITDPWPKDGKFVIVFDAAYGSQTPTLGAMVNVDGTATLSAVGSTYTVTRNGDGTDTVGGTSITIPLDSITNPASGTYAAYTLTTQTATGTGIDTGTAPGTTIP
jgi:hypothetical protein